MELSASTGTIALTGGTGFVGRQILRRLMAETRTVRLIVRQRDDSAPKSGPASIEVIESSDLFAEAPAQLVEMLHGVDTLIHAAWYAEPGKYLDSPRNCDCLIGTIRLAQAFAAAGGRRFIGIGSCFEYDLALGTLSTTTPLKPKTLYAASKVAAFHVLSNMLPGLGVGMAWCRLFYLYGPGEDPRRLVSYLRQRLSAGETAELTSGSQVRDFLDVRDAGARVAEVALGDKQGALNICSGLPITIRQLAEQVADEYGRRDLLRFGARPDNLIDPPIVVGVQE